MSAVIDLYSERCLDLREAGRFLGLCTRTVVREIQRGKLRAFRAGRKWRIQMSELRRYMEAGTVGVCHV
jgi:excisionase family DNA binding protein